MKKDSISTIRFKTLNVGGISGQNKVSTEKRRRIFNSIRHNNDIVILTETKFKSNEMNTYKQDWNSGLLASCTSELRAQAGVAILFRRGLAVDILSHGQDSNGRVVWALVEIYAKKILIIGVYAPAQGDNPKFFTDDVFPILGKVTFDHSVLGGDWNLGMDPSMDYFGYTNADLVRPQSRRVLHQQIDSHDLLDIYRELNQSGTEKTW